jgi:PAS domain S-box-containing protein
MKNIPDKMLGELPWIAWWSGLQWPFRCGLFALCYLAAAEFGHWLSLPAPQEVATFWPASGLYLAVLLLNPRKYWPALVAAALVGNLASDVLLQDKSLLVSVGFATANALEALTGAWLCQRFSRLDQLGNVLGFAVVITLVSTVCGATLGAITLVQAFDAPFMSAWLGWWGADVVGIWIFTPLLVAIGSTSRAAKWPRSVGRWLEAVAMLMGLIAVACFIFVTAYPILGVPFFVLPFLLWAALRLGVGGTALAVFALAMVAVTATINGQGPFIRINLTPVQQVISVQAFLSICALCFFSLAAVTAERWRAVAALRQANHDLEQRVQQRTEELAQANYILQGSEQQMRNVLDSLFAFVGVLTPQGVLLEANRAPLEAAGIGIEDVRGKFFWDCYWWDYAQEAQHQVQEAVNCAAQGKASRFDIEVRVTGNSRIAIDFMLAPLRNGEGQITHLIPSGIDISERKHMEQALAVSENRVRQQLAEIEAVYHTAPVGLCVFDRQLRYIRINERLAEINGISAADHLGKTVRELLPSIADMAESILDEVLITAKPVLNVELNGETPAQPGVLRSWLASWYPLFDDKNLVMGVNVVAMEVTEHKRAEEELQIARAAAEAANLAKSQFLANMSHEIRSPMTAILGYADILAAHLDDPDDLACINTIQRNGKHLLELINDILDLSKIEAERLEISQERFAPVQLIDDVYSLMAMRAQEKGLSLDIVYASPLPETIVSDMRRLKQILINLLSNAIKFTKQGSVTLRVDMMDDPALSKLRFAVIDTGIGITKTQQSKLFQPFSQLDSTLTREHSGSGLGLAISQHLAKLLGGEITLQSRWHTGSTFTLTVATGSLEGVARNVPETRITAEIPANGKAPVALQGHILVVDDRHDIRYLAQRSLEEAGAKVATVESGMAALTAITAADKTDWPFNAVVLDMQMPGMDGYAVARKLRANGFAAPIIALTAHAMKGDREKCLTAGCTEYLSKPVDRQQLIMLVARLTQPTTDTPTTLIKTLPPAQTKVLVVDDNHDAANALAGMLTLLEYPVVAVYDGRSALATARSECPTVIILDINLPDMSGYQVCQQLKQEPTFQQTTFIALSGQDEAAAESLQAGFDFHQLKPASINDIVALFPE